MTPPNFDSADVPNGGEQFRSVRHGFVIVLGFARLNTVDVIGQVEEQVVIEGHALGTPRRALGSVTWGVPCAARVEAQGRRVGDAERRRASPSNVSESHKEILAGTSETSPASGSLKVTIMSNHMDLSTVQTSISFRHIGRRTPSAATCRAQKRRQAPFSLASRSEPLIPFYGSTNRAFAKSSHIGT